MDIRRFSRVYVLSLGMVGTVVELIEKSEGATLARVSVHGEKKDVEVVTALSDLVLQPELPFAEGVPFS